MIIVNTDICRKHLTRLSKYMFFIETCLYFPEKVFNAFQKLEKGIGEDINPINVYIDDENNKDYSIHEEVSSEEPCYLYHTQRVKEVRKICRLLSV